jgi:hypothetical protein
VRCGLLGGRLAVRLRGRGHGEQRDDHASHATTSTGRTPTLFHYGIHWTDDARQFMNLFNVFIV